MSDINSDFRVEKGGKGGRQRSKVKDPLRWDDTEKLRAESTRAGLP